MPFEGIHSYEQRSTSEIGHEFDIKRNRVIIVNRHEPNVAWTTANQPLESKWSAWLDWLRWRLTTPPHWFSSSSGHSNSISSSKLAPTPPPPPPTPASSSSHVPASKIIIAQKSLDGLAKTSDLTRFGSVSSSSTISTTNFHAGPFPSNEWRTSKYTLLNFLPKNLFEQFRRLANFYFLTTAILQCVLPFSPVGPTTSLLPLLFVVSTTAIKQAYEDYLRHKLDDEVNNRSCHVLRHKKLIKIRSKDIRVGDFVYVRNNEEIPCDMILLASSSSPGHDRCYITTANLDGETSLKSRSCFQIREHVGNIEQLDDTLLVIECEKPNSTLYEFSGYLRAPKSKDSYKFLVENLNIGQSTNRSTNRSSTRFDSSYQRDPTIVHTIMRRIRRMRHNATANATIQKNNSKKETKTKPTSAKKLKDQETSQQSVPEFYEIPLDITNLLLRASRLRNTTFIYGLVVYTGRDTKLAHNSQVKSNKFSSTESKVNIYLLLSFLILMFFSLLAAIRYRRPNYWYYEGLERSDSFEQVLVAHFLLYNYLVPISLYVTLEFVKFFGTMAVVDDKKMRTAVWQSVTSETNKTSSRKGETHDSQLSFSSNNRIRVVEGPKCNSSDLNEELGQVEVLFSDKTGTLTENKMKFTACSAFGQLYRAIEQQLYLQPAQMYKAKIPNLVDKLSKVAIGRSSYLTPSITTTDQSHDQTRSNNNNNNNKAPPQTPNKPFDHRIIPPLKKLKAVDESLTNHESIVEFFICLCLCSTITLNETVDLSYCLPDKTGNEYDFQSASPDEESLISAAHQYGITMCKSNDRECYIVIQRPSDGKGIVKPKGEKFKALVESKHSNNRYIVRHFERQIVLEFNSIRKRMSVIYKDVDNDCMLMVTKGSEEMLDCVNMNDLDKDQVQQVNTTLAHFEAFSKSGLRTLLVANRLVGPDEYRYLADEMKEARLSISNRDHLLNRVYQKAECNLKLIGTTAVEDTLQEGVPETIENLKEAGIKVWLLTGDKVETATSVAYLCKLLDREMLLFHLVRQQDVQACQRLLLKFNQQLKQSKDELAFKEQPMKKSLKQKLQNKHKNSFPITSRTRFALIADGRSLHYAIKYAKEELANLCKQCTCVLGCRLSPLQKSEIVDMIKHGKNKPITAAIGDGANDVSMIQEADVGIGICGKEGRQAVNSSDFAINRFHMLNRLLFVHGHLFYHRTANTIHYFFYKNILFVLPQFIYSFYNLSSALSLYHPFLMISYNLFFTSLPILIYGLFEIHIPENILEKFPQLYKLNRHSSQLTVTAFVSWLILGALQSIISFYILYIIWGSHTPFLESGKMAGINGFSIILYFTLILIATLRLYFISKSHSWYFNLSTILSYVLLPVFFYAYSVVDWSFVIKDNSLYGQFLVLLLSPMFWFAIIITTLAAILPDIFWYIKSRIEYFKNMSTMIHAHEIEVEDRENNTI